MATTKIELESKETESDSFFGEKNVRVMEMRLISQNTNVSSITNPNDKRVEIIKAPFSEIVKQNSEGKQNDLIK